MELKLPKIRIPQKSKQVEMELLLNLAYNLTKKERVEIINQIFDQVHNRPNIMFFKIKIEWPDKSKKF